MNKIHPASGTHVFASMTSAAQLDEPRASGAVHLTGVSPGAHANDGDEGQARSPLSRLHAAAPQYRRSLFRR